VLHALLDRCLSQSDALTSRTHSGATPLFVAASRGIVILSSFPMYRIQFVCNCKSLSFDRLRARLSGLTGARCQHF
jgi:hypothetical protein